MIERNFVFAAVGELVVRPWWVIVQVDATVVPWVSVGIEASSGLNGDERSLGYIAGAILED